ncbi:MAG: 2-hydroxyacid dehydrogenase [Rhodospirillaceae bacterium]
MSKTTIVVAIGGTWDVPPWQEEFAKAAKGRRVVFWPQDGVADVPEPYVLCSWKADPKVYGIFTKPQVVFSLGAGVDHLYAVRDKLNAPVVRVINSDLTIRMQEYICLGVLYLHRQVGRHRENQRKRAWPDITQPAANNVRVGIMGPGQLGAASGRALQAIGYDVAGWGRTARAESPFPVFAGRENLDAFLARTEILVNVLPNTPETKGFVGRDVFARLAKMPGQKGAYFISAGRGETVVEPELVEALQSGVLAGAVLDVFNKEPLPDDSPLWAMENVLITPHAAADSDPPSIVAQIMGTVEALERGEQPRITVDLSRGY